MFEMKKILKRLFCLAIAVVMLMSTAGAEGTSTRIISLKVNNSDISRLRDARDTIAVGQQGQVLYLLVEP